MKSPLLALVVFVEFDHISSLSWFDHDCFVAIKGVWEGVIRHDRFESWILGVWIHGVLKPKPVF